jgi:hypothetical protein
MGTLAPNVWAARTVRPSKNLAPPVVAQQAAGGPTALFTFGYTDLDGVFDGTSTWTMRATEFTAGDVTRGIAPFTTANFDAGFAGATADFQLDMNVAPVSSGLWSGTGTFLITDADGDTIFGTFNGDWERLSGENASFSGLIKDVDLTTTGGDNTFDGTDGGSVDLDFGVLESQLSGAVVVLEAGGWFGDGAFNDMNSLVQGTVVPAPGAALLGMLGLAAVGYARRRQQGEAEA